MLSEKLRRGMKRKAVKGEEQKAFKRGDDKMRRGIMNSDRRPDAKPMTGELFNWIVGR